MGVWGNLYKAVDKFKIEVIGNIYEA
jgi:hypothetical protein